MFFPSDKIGNLLIRLDSFTYDLFYTVTDFRPFELQNDKFIEFEEDSFYDAIANNLENALFVDQHLKYKDRIVLKYFNYAYSKRLYRNRKPRRRSLSKICRVWIKLLKEKLVIKLKSFKKKYYIKKILFLKTLYVPREDLSGLRFLVTYGLHKNKPLYTRISKINFIKEFISLLLERVTPLAEDTLILLKSLKLYHLNVRFWAYYRKAAEDWSYYSLSPQYEKLNFVDISYKIPQLQKLKIKTRTKLKNRLLYRTKRLHSKNVYAKHLNMSLKNRFSRLNYRRIDRLTLCSKMGYYKKKHRSRRFRATAFKIFPREKLEEFVSYLKTKNFSTLERNEICTKFVLELKKNENLKLSSKKKKPKIKKIYSLNRLNNLPLLKSYTETGSLFSADSAFGHPNGLNFVANPDFFWDEWDPAFLKQQNGLFSDFGEEDYLGHDRFYSKAIPAVYTDTALDALKTFRPFTKRIRKKIIRRKHWHRKTDFEFSKRFLRRYGNIIYETVDEPEWDSVPGKTNQLYDLNLGDGPNDFGIDDDSSNEDELFDFSADYDAEITPFSLCDWYTFQRVNAIDEGTSDYYPVSFTTEGLYEFYFTDFEETVESKLPEVESVREAFFHRFRKTKLNFDFPYLNKDFKAKIQSPDEFDIFFDSTLYSFSKRLKKFWTERVPVTPLLKFFNLHDEYKIKQSRAFLYHERSSKVKPTDYGTLVSTLEISHIFVFFSFCLSFFTVLVISFLTILANLKSTSSLVIFYGPEFEFWNQNLVPNFDVGANSDQRTTTFNIVKKLYNRTAYNIQHFFSSDAKKIMAWQKKKFRKDYYPFYNLSYLDYVKRTLNMVDPLPFYWIRARTLESFEQFYETLDDLRITNKEIGNPEIEYELEELPRVHESIPSTLMYNYRTVKNDIVPLRSKKDEVTSSVGFWHRVSLAKKQKRLNFFTALNSPTQGNFYEGISQPYLIEPDDLEFDETDWLHHNYKIRKVFDRKLNHIVTSQDHLLGPVAFHTSRLADDQARIPYDRIRAFKATQAVSGFYNNTPQFDEHPYASASLQRELLKSSNDFFTYRYEANPQNTHFKTYLYKLLTPLVPSISDSKLNLPITANFASEAACSPVSSARRFFDLEEESNEPLKEAVALRFNPLRDARTLEASVRTIGYKKFLRFHHSLSFPSKRHVMGPEAFSMNQIFDLDIFDVNPFKGHFSEVYRVTDVNPQRLLSTPIDMYHPRFRARKRFYRKFTARAVLNSANIFIMNPAYRMYIYKGYSEYFKEIPSVIDVSRIKKIHIPKFKETDHRSTKDFRQKVSYTVDHYYGQKKLITDNFFKSRVDSNLNIFKFDSKIPSNRTLHRLGSFEFFCAEDDFKIFSARDKPARYIGTKHGSLFNENYTKRALYKLYNRRRQFLDNSIAMSINSRRNRLNPYFKAQNYKLFLSNALPFNVDIFNFKTIIDDQPFGREFLPYTKLTPDYLDFNRDIPNRRFYLLTDTMSNAYNKSYAYERSYKNWWFSKVNRDPASKIHRSLLQINTSYQASFLMNIPTVWETYLNSVWLSSMADPYRTNTTPLVSDEDSLRKLLGGAALYTGIYRLQSIILDLFEPINLILIRNVLFILALFYIFGRHTLFIRSLYFKRLGFVSFSNSRIRSSNFSNKLQDSNPEKIKIYNLRRKFNPYMFKKHNKSNTQKDLLNLLLPEEFEGGREYKSYKFLIRPKTFLNKVYKAALKVDHFKTRVFKPKFKKIATTNQLTKFASIGYSFLWSLPIANNSNSFKNRRRSFRNKTLQFFETKKYNNLAYTKSNLPYKLSNSNFLSGFINQGEDKKGLSHALYDYSDPFSIDVHYNDSLNHFQSYKSSYLRADNSPFLTEVTLDKDLLLKDKRPWHKQLDLNEEDSEVKARRTYWSNFASQNRSKRLLFKQKAKFKPFTEDRLRQYLLGLERLHHKADIDLISALPITVADNYIQQKITEDLTAYNGGFISTDDLFSQELLQDYTDNVGILVDTDEDDIDESLNIVDDLTSENATELYLHDESDHEESVESLFTDLVAQLTPPNALVEVTLNSLLAPNSRAFMNRSTKPVQTSTNYFIYSELINYKMWRTQSLDFYTLDLPVYEFSLPLNDFGIYEEEVVETLNFSLTNFGLPAQYGLNFLVPYSFPRFLKRLEKAEQEWSQNRLTLGNPSFREVLDPLDPDKDSFIPFYIELKNIASEPQLLNSRESSPNSYESYFKPVQSDKHKPDINQIYSPYSGDLLFKTGTGLISEEFFSIGLAESFNSTSSTDCFNTEEESNLQMLEPSSHYRWRFLSSEYLQLLASRPDEFFFTQLRAFKGFNHAQPDDFITAENFNFNKFLESSLKYLYYSEFGSDSDLINDFIAHWPQVHAPFDEDEDEENEDLLQLYADNDGSDDPEEEDPDEDFESFEMVGDHDYDALEDDVEQLEGEIDIEADFLYEYELTALELAFRNVDIADFSTEGEDFRLDTISRATTSSIFISSWSEKQGTAGISTLPIRNLEDQDYNRYNSSLRLRSRFKEDISDRVSSPLDLDLADILIPTTQNRVHQTLENDDNILINDTFEKIVGYLSKEVRLRAVQDLLLLRQEVINRNMVKSLEKRIPNIFSNEVTDKDLVHYLALVKSPALSSSLHKTKYGIIHELETVRLSDANELDDYETELKLLHSFESKYMRNTDIKSNIYNERYDLDRLKNNFRVESYDQYYNLFLRDTNSLKYYALNLLYFDDLNNRYYESSH